VPMPPRGMPAAVDISRSRISQGALEAFQALKQKLGLDATFGKFRGPASNPSGVLHELQAEATARRKNQQVPYPPDPAKEAGPVAMDPVIENIMDAIAESMVSSRPLPAGRGRGALQGATWTPTGVAGIRKKLGNMMPFLKDKQTDTLGVDTRGQMKMDDFRGLMQHLDKYGLISEKGLDPHLQKQAENYDVGFNAQVLERLKRFIEETKE
jgi:hypothetical protein